MSLLSREAILTVLSGLTVFGCDKTAPVAAEPVVATQSAAAVAPAAAVASAATVASAAPAVAAKEVPSANGAAEKEKSCAPGGCAPGECGANKKK